MGRELVNRGRESEIVINGVERFYKGLFVVELVLVVNTWDLTPRAKF